MEAEAVFKKTVGQVLQPENPLAQGHTSLSDRSIQNKPKHTPKDQMDNRPDKCHVFSRDLKHWRCPRYLQSFSCGTDIHHIWPLPQVEQVLMAQKCLAYGTVEREEEGDVWSKIVKTKKRIIGNTCLKRTLEEAIKRHQKTAVPQPAIGVAAYFGISCCSCSPTLMVLCPWPFLFCLS